ncbi:MAG: hypothetical protein ACLTW9_13660 [Enterocloster sp.]
MYVNDGEVMELASGMDSGDQQQRYDSRNRLSEVFRVAMVPSQDTISAMFYLKDGCTVYLKDEIRIPKEIMEQEAWYRQALAGPNVVSVGAFDTSRQNLAYSRLKSGEFVLAGSLFTRLSGGPVRENGDGQPVFRYPCGRGQSADSTGTNNWAPPLYWTAAGALSLPGTG